MPKENDLMRYVILDGRTIKDMDEVHGVFAEALDLPDYYGRNLDALHDCLTEQAGEIMVVILESELMSAALGDKFSRLLMLLSDVLEERDGFSVYI